MKSTVIALALLFPSVALAEVPQPGAESYPIQGKSNCADFDKIVKVMAEGDAKPFMYILSEDGKSLVVFFGNEKTTEWLAFRRDANSKMACMVDNGVGFGVIPEYRGAGI